MKTVVNQTCAKLIFYWSQLISGAMNFNQLEDFKSSNRWCSGFSLLTDPSSGHLKPVSWPVRPVGPVPDHLTVESKVSLRSDSSAKLHI